MSKLVLAALLLAALLSPPASAQLQYFGYVGAGDDDVSLGKTKAYTNFAHIGTSDYLYDSFITSRVNALSQRGMKATIDLGKVLWCDYDGTFQYRYLCSDWLQRWTTWKNYNASVLTSSKVIAMTVRDEPFNYDVNMSDFEMAAARIKADLPWVKLWMVEAACVVASDNCGWFPGAGALARYTGTLPNIDWIGLDNYSIHPATDPTLQTARNKMRTKFPGKKWLYVADGWWNDDHASAFYPNGQSYMSTIAREWYDYARADANAVLLGVFIWPTFAKERAPSTSRATCSRSMRPSAGPSPARPGARPRSAPSRSTPMGWSPAGPAIPTKPSASRIPSSTSTWTGRSTPPSSLRRTTLSPTSSAAPNRVPLQVHPAQKLRERTVTVTGTDVDSPGAQIASSCSQSPACSWTPHLQHFGYVGAGDDTQNRGLDETKGFTNFAHIASKADLTGADRYFVRDRVTAMSQRGIKATIDLGLVLWCGAPTYRNLCSDWAQRWETWKTNNASILTSDKVLAFAILDEPFNRRANMTHYETAAAKVKADFPWAKLWMVEAACVVYGDNCGYYPGYGAFAAYTGTLPNIDWIGLNSYAIRPSTDNTFQKARTRMKQKFPGRKWLYVMDGYWDSGHSTIGSSVNSMKNIAREWFNVARDDFDSVLLGVFLWSPLSGSTTSKDFPCHVLSEHREIGREVTGKTRRQTAAPVGKLENLFNGSGTAPGYACDPDGTICEDPRIDFYSDGTYYNPRPTILRGATTW